MKKAYPHLV